MTIILEMVRNVLDKQFEDFDSQTIEYAKIRIMDTVGAIIGGVNSSGADMILELVKQWGGREESTILPVGEKVPATNAVLAMGIMARSNDFEPGGGPLIDGKKSPGHYSATTVPTALSVSEKLGLDGKTLITSLILGDDLASRIGVAGAGPIEATGWDPAGTCSRFGASAIAGKLIGLDETQMLNALGIVFTQMAGTMQPVFEYTHSFKLSQGVAGWNGILSAELAKKGFTGPRDPLMGEFGYFRQYCKDVDRNILTKDLGKRYYSDEEFKLYPCCRGNAGSVESAKKLVKENDLYMDNIAEINIDVAPGMKDSFLNQPFRTDACPQATGILNIKYNVANVLLRKDAKLEHYTDEAICDPEILKVIQKIRINPILKQGGRLSSLIRVKMNNGREFSEFTDIPRGDFYESPLTKDEIRSKFRASAGFTNIIKIKKVEKALNLIENLEELDNVRVLVKSLIPD